MPNKLRTWLLKPVIVLAALGLSGTALLATAAVASATTPVTASTSVTNHPDTTIGGLPGHACGTSAGGPTWATDAFTAAFTATQETTPANTWMVAVTINGSFVGFADPATCDALTSTGSLSGTYDLTVTSATAPTAAGLKASYSGPSGTFTQMVTDLFGGKATNIAGGAYDFSYQGGNYVQDTSGERGDVVGVTCTVTVTNPGTQDSVLNTAISGLQIVASSNYPGTLYYEAGNLPKGLSIDPWTGKITGTPVKTGTSVVTVTVVNKDQSREDMQCKGTAQFNWTVSLTAPSPSPSPSSSSAPPPPSSTVPAGGVQTGGGKPVTSTLVPFGIVLGSLGLLIVGFAYARPRRSER